MKKLKLYLETSFWNYAIAEDYPERGESTKNLLDNILSGQAKPYISDLVLEEINEAPEPKKSKMSKLIKDSNSIVLEITEDIISLAQCYLNTGSIPISKRADALHVAVATVNELDILVSWNYRHLANVRRKELVNSTNLHEGYTKTLEMVTPLEVTFNE